MSAADLFLYADMALGKAGGLKREYHLSRSDNVSELQTSAEVGRTSGASASPPRAARARRRSLFRSSCGSSKKCSFQAMKLATLEADEDALDVRASESGEVSSAGSAGSTGAVGAPRPDVAAAAETSVNGDCEERAETEKGVANAGRGNGVGLSVVASFAAAPRLADESARVSRLCSGCCSCGELEVRVELPDGSGDECWDLSSLKTPSLRAGRGGVAAERHHTVSVFKMWSETQGWAHPAQVPHQTTHQIPGLNVAPESHLLSSQHRGLAQPCIPRPPSMRSCLRPRHPRASERMQR